MSPDLKRQIFQSIGQFLAVFLTGMAVFKDWNAVVAVGIANAIWQPSLQAALATLGIHYVSKIGPKGGGV